MEEERETSKPVEELKDTETIPISNVEESNGAKDDSLSTIQDLRERTSKEGADSTVHGLFALLESLKVIERQEFDLKSGCDERCSKLQADIDKLEELILNKDAEVSFTKDFDNSFGESTDNLNKAKTELATKLREIVSLRRQLGNVPSQGELIQYELRFSELYVHIQEKLRQTRRYYATFNALLEMKELMLKETSILNSINTQFQDAIASTGGRMKLIDSMEGISKGIQQKLKKIQLAQESEQEICDTLKGKYTAALSEQRRCSSLLKSFQEECAKNERLQKQTSGIPSSHVQILDPLLVKTAK